MGWLINRLYLAYKVLAADSVFMISFKNEQIHIDWTRVPAYDLIRMLKKKHKDFTDEVTEGERQERAINNLIDGIGVKRAEN